MDEKQALELRKEVEETKKRLAGHWCFFDFSGTLVDTALPLSKTWTRFLNKDFPPEKVRSMYKDFHNHRAIVVFWKYKINPFKMLFGGKKKFERIRREEFWKGTKAFPGISEVLTRLRKISNVNLGIVTYDTELADEERREEILQHFGVPVDFDVVITDDKNKAKRFDLFIQDNPVSYGIIIGDSQSDLNLSKEHGFTTIGVTWGYSSREELEGDFVVEDPRELLQVLLNLLHKAEQGMLHGDPIPD